MQALTMTLFDVLLQLPTTVFTDKEIFMQQAAETKCGSCGANIKPDENHECPKKKATNTREEDDFLARNGLLFTGGDGELF